MSDSAQPVTSPESPAAKPPIRSSAWALLVFESLQVVVTAVYIASGLIFETTSIQSGLVLGLGAAAAVVSLIWAIVLLRGTARRLIPRLVATLSGIEIGVFAILVILTVAIDSQLHP